MLIKKYIEFKFEAATILENKIIFVDIAVNIICALDLDTQKIEILGLIPEEFFECEHLCGDIVVWKNEIIFIPLMAKKIWILNLISNKWNDIPLKDEKIPYKFLNTILYENKIFMAGHYMHSLLCLDLITKKIIDLTELCEYTGGDALFGPNSEVIGNKWYLPCCNEAAVLQIDLKTYDRKYFKFDSQSEGFQGIAWDGKYFWLAPRINGEIIKWNPFGIYSETVLKENVKNVLGVIAFDEKIYMPSYGNNSAIFIYNGEIKYLNNEKDYIYAKKINNDYFLLEKSNGTVILYNKKDNKVKYLSLHMERRVFLEEINKMKKYNYVTSNFLKENDFLFLDIFLKLIDKSKKENHDKQNKYGENIYQGL